ncbi:hypothetical protein QTP70_020058, partial [Hemibagrus guttatus]
MEAAQLNQQRAYKQPTKLREFQPGDQVLLLIPNAACKFLTQWQGPFTIFKRMGLVNYHLQQLEAQSGVGLQAATPSPKWMTWRGCGEPDLYPCSTLQRGTWQVALAPNVIEKKSFSTASGHWLLGHLQHSR